MEFVLELRLEEEPDLDPDLDPSTSHTHTDTHIENESQSHAQEQEQSESQSRTQSCGSVGSAVDSDSEQVEDGSLRGGGMAGDRNRNDHVGSDSNTQPSSFSSSSVSSCPPLSMNAFTVVQLHIIDPNSPQRKRKKEDDNEDKNKGKIKDKDMESVAVFGDRDRDRDGSWDQDQNQVDESRSLKPPRDDGYAAVVKLGK